MTRFVTFGEIMGRLATPGFQRFSQAMPGTLNLTFAGAEASVAASLAQLGAAASFVTALPTHAVAEACLADLRALDVDTSHVLRTAAGRLGLFFLEMGVNQRPSRVIYDRAGSAVACTPSAAYPWQAILADADWFMVSGITPAISPQAAEATREAITTAAAQRVPVAFDVNFRSKLWRWHETLGPRDLATETLRDLLPSVQLIVIGRDDLEALLAGPPERPLETLVRQLAAAYPGLGTIAVTQRQRPGACHPEFGGLLYDRGTEQIYAAPAAGQRYVIPQVVDRIGTGDAFTAALLFAKTTAELAAPQAALAFATAAGCLAHSTEGDVHRSQRAEIEALLEGDGSGRVIR